MGVTNPVFPNLTLYTNELDITKVNGIAGVSTGTLPDVKVEDNVIVINAGKDVNSEIFASSGATVATATGKARISVPSGIYLVRCGKAAVKVIVK